MAATIENPDPDDKRFPTHLRDARAHRAGIARFTGLS
jgi:hypothetical protein